MFSKRDFVEEIVRGFGFDCFVEDGRPNIVEVFRAGSVVDGQKFLRGEVGQIWWKDADGSVVTCQHFFRFLTVEVDLAEPGSIERMRDYFVKD